MIKLIKRIGGLLFIASFLFLTACGSNGSQSPTPDPALIYTSAAQTVEAELTLTSVPNPETPTITAFPLTTETPGLPTAILGNGVLPNSSRTANNSNKRSLAPPPGATHPHSTGCCRHLAAVPSR